MYKVTPKDYSNTYLYSMSPNIEKQIFEFIMKGQQVDKDVEAFDDIRYDVKRRQVTNTLTRILDSNNVVLMIADNPLPKAFKVFTATDVKGSNTKKTFIDCTGVIRFEDGVYKCREIDMLIAYLVSAMTNRIYFGDVGRIVNNPGVINEGARAFSSLFCHIIDYLYKVSIIPATKAKCSYMVSLYYLTNVLGHEIDDSKRAIARKISGISEREEEVILLQLEDGWNVNIKLFVETLSKVLRLTGLTLEVIVEKWILFYGTGTHYSMELFCPFASMLTDTYVDCMIVNKKTIEKIVGPTYVEFTKAIFNIGSSIK